VIDFPFFDERFMEKWIFIFTAVYDNSGSKRKFGYGGQSDISVAAAEGLFLKLSTLLMALTICSQK
jgi:hypothetical protein